MISILYTSNTCEPLCYW